MYSSIFILTVGRTWPYMCYVCIRPQSPTELYLHSTHSHREHGVDHLSNYSHPERIQSLLENQAL